MHFPVEIILANASQFGTQDAMLTKVQRSTKCLFNYSLNSLFRRMYISILNVFEESLQCLYFSLQNFMLTDLLPVQYVAGHDSKSEFCCNKKTDLQFFF